MCATAELDRCPFFELCEDCHPEVSMVEYREKCSCENCDRCGVYWAFHSGYYGWDDD